MSAKQVAYTVQTSKAVSQTAESVTAALKLQSFGVLNTVNIRKIIKEKLGKTIDEYLIIEVCNSKDAYYALSKHKDIGLMLPCKIIVYKDDDKTTVSLYRPTEALKALGFTDLESLATEVEGQLKQAIDSAVA
jgi:uncharacterized protein (DUF302 family)